MEKINYPLINFERDCNSQVAKCFFEKLMQKTIELKANPDNANFAPFFKILKTKNNLTFGVIVSKETRYHKKNFIHKFGYKSNRISYPASIFDDENLMKYFLGFKASQMVPVLFTNLSAYTLSKDKKLIKIGQLCYSITKHKKDTIAYIDGLSVQDNLENKNYREKGIANALLDFAHLLIINSDATIIYADAKKIDNSYKIGDEWKILKEPKSVSFNMLMKRGYQIESQKMYKDKYANNTPLFSKIDNIKNINKNKKIDLNLSSFE